MKKKGFYDYLKQQAGEGIHYIYCAHCKVDADYISDRLERHWTKTTLSKFNSSSTMN